jgi:DNA-binding transcriptional LysR family regulator
VSLTPAGMAFYAYALAITDQTERIKAHLKRLYDTGTHGRPARPPCKGSYKHF